MPFTLEVTVDNLESAINAIDGGADRLVVCSALSYGGLTPNASLLKGIQTYAIQRGINVQLATVIRPRLGDFIYTPRELFQFNEEIHSLKDLSNSYVLGCLVIKDGQITIDEAACSTLVRLCHPKEITFHRAFDLCTNIPDALGRIVALGFTRVTTSGGQKKAIDGIDVIKMCVDLVQGKIRVMAGGGIDQTNVATIVEKTGVIEIHSSAGGLKQSLMAAQCEKIFPNGGVASWKVADRSKVFEIKSILDKLTASQTSLVRKSSLAKQKSKTNAKSKTGS